VTDMHAPLVLVVDDDQDFLEMTRAVLEKGGYRVACAADPKTALDMMIGEVPDLVITDLMMQNLGSGFSLSRRIKETPHLQNVPVIIVTAAASRLGYDFAPRNAADLAAMSADAFIEKPMSPKELLARTDGLVGGGEREKRS